MSASNLFHVIGNLTADAEMKYLSSGTPVLSFSVAQNYKKRKGDEWVDAVNFFTAEWFGKRAEALFQYLLKGKPVAIEGEMRQDRWADDAGKTQSRYKIYVDDLRLLSSGQRDGGAEERQHEENHRQEPQRRPAESKSDRPPITAQETLGDEFEDEDSIPF